MEKLPHDAVESKDSSAIVHSPSENCPNPKTEPVLGAMESSSTDPVTAGTDLPMNTGSVLSPTGSASPLAPWSGTAKTFIATMLTILQRAVAGIRIAFVRLWSPPYEDEKTGGSLYGMMNIYADLVKVGFLVDLISFSDEKKTKAWQPDFKRLSWSDTTTLNSYDFVIFNTAGSFKDKENGEDLEWLPILKALAVPFAVQIHDEAEPQYLTGREHFFSHEKCAVFLPITPGIGERMVTAPGDRKIIVYPNFQTLEPLNPAQYYPEKTDQIVTTCRMTTRKRIKELVQQAHALSEKGLQLDVHGAAAEWRYKKALEDLNVGHWRFHGTFEREQLSDILVPAKFHYNVCMLKNQHFERRLEISTVEAIAYGCTPILCESTVPGWVTPDMAILVDPANLDGLADRLDEAKARTAGMNARLVKAFNEENNPSRLVEFAEAILAHVSKAGRPVTTANADPTGITAHEDSALPLIPPLESTATAEPVQDDTSGQLQNSNGPSAVGHTASDSGRSGNGNGSAGGSKFDFKRYDRRATNFDGMLGGIKKLSRIPVKKPERDWWVRAHSAICCEPGVYEDKSNREFYIVEPDLYPLFGNKLVYRTLFLAINSQGLIFWWPVNTDNNGRFNSWSDSALEAVQDAKKGWIRIEANMQAGAYDVYAPSGKIPEPDWPQEDINVLLETAFKGKIIDSPDHPIILHLEGRLA